MNMYIYSTHTHILWWLQLLNFHREARSELHHLRGQLQDCGEARNGRLDHFESFHKGRGMKISGTDLYLRRLGDFSLLYTLQVALKLL